MVLFTCIQSAAASAPPPLLLLCVFAICTAVAVAVAAFAAFAARHRVPNGQICRCFKVTFGNSCG